MREGRWDPEGSEESSTESLKSYDSVNVSNNVTTDDLYYKDLVSYTPSTSGLTDYFHTDHWFLNICVTKVDWNLNPPLRDFVNRSSIDCLIPKKNIWIFFWVLWFHWKRKVKYEEVRSVWWLFLFLFLTTDNKYNDLWDSSRGTTILLNIKELLEWCRSRYWCFRLIILTHLHRDDFLRRVITWHIY